MVNDKIHWKKALELINNDISVIQKNIDFNNEIIHIHDVIILNSRGINVPEVLINYDDDNIDCSDIPEITIDDIKSKKMLT